MLAGVQTGRGRSYRPEMGHRSDQFGLGAPACLACASLLSVAYVSGAVPFGVRREPRQEPRQRLSAVSRHVNRSGARRYLQLWAAIFTSEGEVLRLKHGVPFRGLPEDITSAADVY